VSESPHLRRLASRLARTGDRLIDHALRENVAVADLRNIRLPWYTVRNFGHDPAGGGSGDATATVFIFDEIGGSLGIDANQLIRELQDVTAPTIHVRINSPGGSVFDAVAIHNALRHHPADVICYVDALAASAASIIAVAGDEVVMMPASQMMIHDASAVVDGNAADLTKMATFLNRQSDNLADRYRMKAGGTLAEWRALMTAETWLFAREAVELGLADRTDEPAEDLDAELAGLMGRTFDLTQYGYRDTAPTPGTHTPHQRGRGDTTTNLLRRLGDLS
jgi:ATP-dependent protease ClpP protease subunit